MIDKPWPCYIEKKSLSRLRIYYNFPKTCLEKRLFLLSSIEVYILNYLEWIVELHLDENKSTQPSQLIVTTHQTNILDLNLLRKDEIWFVEKNPETGATDLYSLYDFQPRYDKDIKKDYLYGRYGAIPFLGNMSALKLPSKKK